MRLVFAATPEFTIPVLERLNATHGQLVAVYTKPDRGSGRGRQLSASPVKQWAQDKHLALEQPQLWDQSALSQLQTYQPDIMIVMAYGMLLPTAVLSAPVHGSVNAHLSLLPRWRGAAPIARAIEHGDQTTGVSLMKMVEQLDAGPIISQKNCPIEKAETSHTLQGKLSTITADMVNLFLTDPESYLAQATPQSETEICYASKIKKEEAWIDWTLTAAEIERKIRAFNPAPVARTYYQARVLRIWEATACDQETAWDVSPGHMMGLTGNALLVSCGKGVLQVQTLQLAGKRVMSVKDFASGHPVIGECFQSPPVAD